MREQTTPMLTAFGTRICLLRQEAELTQQQLAEAVGLTRSSIANIERGQQEPGLDTVGAFADALGVTVDQLLGRGPHPGLLPWHELACRVTASERSNHVLAENAWRRLDITQAVHYRGMAEGLALACEHQLTVIAETRKQTEGK